MISGNFDLNLFSFLFLNAIVLFNSVLIAFFLLQFNIQNWGKFFLTTFIIYTLQVFISQILLGFFGILTYGAVWAVHIAFCIATVAIYGIKKRAPIQFSKFPRIKDHPILIIFIPFLALFLLRYFYALFQVPIEYDSISYHLPFVVEWYKSHSLMQIYYSVFTGPVGYYPSNFELFELWSALPFGKDFLVNLINIPLVAFLIVSVYLIAKNLFIKPVNSWIAVGFLLYIPIVPHFFGFTHVDLFFTVVFLTSIFFLQEFWTTKSLGDLILCGLSFGFFIGTKYLGIPYVLPLLLISSIAILLHFFRTKIKILLAFLILAGTSLLGGGFWYLRNYLNSGNPIFPTEISLFGHKIFEGYLHLTEKIFLLSLSYNVNDYAKLKEFLHGFFEKVGMHMPIIVLFIVILSLFILILAVKYSIKKINKTLGKKILTDLIIGLILMASAIYYFYFYWQTPYTYSSLIPNVRYSLMFLAVSAFIFGFVMDRIKWIRPLGYCLLAASAVYNIAVLIINNPKYSFMEGDKIVLDWNFLLNNQKYLLFFLACSCLLFVIFHLSGSLKSSKPKFFLITFMLLVFIVSSCFLLKTTIPKREEYKNYFFDKYYAVEPLQTLPTVHAAEWLDKNDPFAGIAYAGFSFHYNLFGREWQREVDYVNINECTNCRYVDYKNSEQSVRRDPNYDKWLDNLKTKQKKYLVIITGILKGLRNYELEWVKEHDKTFKKVYHEGNVYIYRINNVN